jgi:serine/threonine-protein kinase
VLAGGQGAVYICRDANLDRKVAVKALHTTGSAAGLSKEIEARAKIKSKHVAEIYDVLVGATGEPLAVVLEYVPGETLQDPSALPLATDARLRLLYQLACGISEIHSANVIHRDIKPSNIKVDSSGTLKIFDLGLANLDADSASTVGAAGTLVYRAPEFYGTPPLVVTRAADIYAYGVVAWHVLFQKFPSPLLEVPPQHSGVALPKFSSVVSDLFEVGSILDQSLIADPLQRPSAPDIVAALRQRILRGKTRGVFTYGVTNHELSAAGNVTTLKVGALGQIEVHYDGNYFVVRACIGSVFVNNVAAVPGMRLPDSCVLTFADPGNGSTRAFIPFNSSQPQIVI